VIEVEDFLAEREKIEPDARRLISCAGEKLPIAADLDDGALVRDLVDVPRTALEPGISETLAIFRNLQHEGRLDSSDLAT
jgi:hypothetical protein